MESPAITPNLPILNVAMFGKRFFPNIGFNEQHRQQTNPLQQGWVGLTGSLFHSVNSENYDFLGQPKRH